MALTKIPVITREFYRIPVQLTVNGDIVNPTTLTVEFAIVATGVLPDDPDWVTGSWETLDADVGSLLAGTTLARVLVGDSLADIPLTQGVTYDAWLRITDSPERPARMTGTILAT